MKFLVDAQLPPALCRWLEQRGHDAIHVSARPEALADRVISQWAEEEGRVLISKDEDFRTLRLPDRFSLIWLRCGNVTNPGLTAWLETRWPTVERLLGDGERIIELI